MGLINSRLRDQYLHHVFGFAYPFRIIAGLLESQATSAPEDRDLIRDVEILNAIRHSEELAVPAVAAGEAIYHRWCVIFHMCCFNKNG